MTFNESLTLILSGLALLVSVISAVISFRQAKSETRNQLNELIQEIVKTRSERADAWTRPKIAFLARQAGMLIDQVPELITDIDYSVTAEALAFLGDAPRSAAYWQKAVDLSPSDFYRVINKRGFASFLFWQGKHEQGRKMYREALEIFDVTSDFNKYTNGYTYQMWFNSEAWNVSQSFSEAHTYYKQARGLFESISSAQWKASALADLEAAARQLPPPPATKSPFVPAQVPAEKA